MRTYLPLAGFALVVSLAACGAKVTVDNSSGTTAGAGGTGGAPVAKIGHFQADCAPNDGPATTFVFEDLAGCTPPSGSVPLVQISVFNDQLASVHSGGVVLLGADINGGAVGFTVSVGPGGEVTGLPIAAGSLTFDTVVDGTSATGAFHLTLQGGTTAEGTFSVVWCTGGVLCG
jgi:hypothetical protein